MVISRTPLRLSFFGGGTDYPSWFRRHGGEVLATTIDKYCYLTCRYLPPFFEHKIRIIYSKIENCQTIDEIAHPAAREVLRYLDIRRGVEIHHDADLPARSGMGTSSAFTVGLLNAIHALKGEIRTKRDLAMEAIDIEQNILKEAVGSQDQVLAAYGGFNHIQFLPNDTFVVNPVTLLPKRIAEFNSYLMLFYTGIRRTASDIASTFVDNLESRRRQLRTMTHLVNEAKSILVSGGPIEGIGELLHEAWEAKRSLSSSVSNTEIDSMYEAARAAGAIGGKLAGAGGGGFMLLFVPPAKQPQVREALSRLTYVPFKFEFSGSQIIFYDLEEEYEEVTPEDFKRRVQKCDKQTG
ncbi:MAG: kinase [Armatimonadetes bacterium]|nr:kinase [Armatimonadota bacterium]